MVGGARVVQQAVDDLRAFVGRIVRGEGFNLVGGSEDTHERMTETVIKTSEDLSRKGRTIAEAHPEELADLLRKHDRGA